MCWDNPADCTFGWGDPYNNSCVHKCTGPSPWNTFGDNSTHLCTTKCSSGSYADIYIGTRICVAVCPGEYDVDGIYIGTIADSYGDDGTRSCVLYCVTPERWADWQTHKCVARCSGDNSSMVPTYASKTGRCVIAIWCPKAPDLLYGDNITRQCTTSCFKNSTYV